MHTQTPTQNTNLEKKKGNLQILKFKIMVLPF